MRTSTLASLILVLVACGQAAGPAGPPVPRAPAPQMLVSPLSETPSRTIAPLPEGTPGNAERIALCLRLLESGTIAEVNWAAEQLGRIGAEAVLPLAEKMTANLRTNPAFARNALAVFKDHLPGHEAVEAIAAVADGPDPSLRLGVAEALSRTELASTIEPLVALAGDRKDFRISGAALAALRSTPPGPTFKALRSVFPDALHPATRAEAIPVFAESLPGEDADELLRGLLASRDIELATRAGIELLPFHEEEATTALRNQLEKGVPLPLEFRVLAALADRRDPLALERLLGLTASEDDPGALPAVDHLAKYDDDRVDETLDRLAHAADQSVAAVALSAFVARGSPRALELLDEMIASGERDRRIVAALALGRLRGPEFSGRASRAADAEKDSAVRIKLLTAIGIIGDPAGAYSAVRAIRDETETTSGRADMALNGADTLILMPELPGAVLADLVKIAGEGSLAQRVQACRVLGRHGRGPAAGAAILGLLNSEYPDARMVAMAAWVAFADATPEPLLDVAARERSRLRAAELRTAAERVRCRLLR